MVRVSENVAGPKEVWASITWVVYACHLHARATAGWKGHNSAVIALVGLATLLFNFMDIKFSFGNGSQHSYAEPALRPAATAMRRRHEPSVGRMAPRKGSMARFLYPYR